MDRDPQIDTPGVRPAGHPASGLPGASAGDGTRDGALVVPFPTDIRPRRTPVAGEARGEILLFVGVRYERLAS